MIVLKYDTNSCLITDVIPTGYNVCYAEETRPLELNVCRFPVLDKHFVIDYECFLKRRKTQ